MHHVVTFLTEAHHDWLARGGKGGARLPGLHGTKTTEQERDGPYYPQQQTEVRDVYCYTQVVILDLQLNPVFGTS